MRWVGDSARRDTLVRLFVLSFKLFVRAKRNLREWRWARVHWPVTPWIEVLSREGWNLSD